MSPENPQNSPRYRECVQRGVQTLFFSVLCRKLLSQFRNYKKLFDLCYFAHSKTSHVKETRAQLLLTNLIVTLINVSKAILKTYTSKIVNTGLLNHIKYNYF